jgi:signal transduction histidine kinase/ActR/RegA family two-component response regulator
LALRGRDAEVVGQLLARQGEVCRVCKSLSELAREAARGAGCAVVTEESLAGDDFERLTRWLDEQPPWSDFPFILLATKRSGHRPQAALMMLEKLGNVVVLERPIHGETLARAVASAQRGRRRQYEARRRLLDLAAAEARLKHLNATLEGRIAQRTQELSDANNQLMQEIAERERAQAALAQAQKMEAIGQLTGGIAHDFNNLLTVIGGNLEMVQRRVTDDRTAVMTQSALHAADRAGKLTRQLLAFSRSQRLTLRPVDLNALIAETLDLVARTIGPQYAIEVHAAPEPIWAMADANQVELAILNLAINARDAMPGGGALRISSAIEAASDPSLSPGDYAVVRVADTGAGIPPDVLPRVIEPFFTTKAIGKGTGLGLSQVYGIARQSDGTVRIESTVGEGTTVEIWLPVAPEALRTARPQVEAPAERDGDLRRVLVIEDDAGVRDFVVECLQTLGYRVEAAVNGEEGLERLRAASWELAIVDFAMPGMNGAEVVAEARKFAPDLPIILATGHADMQAVDRVMKPEQVLLKPFQIRELEAAIQTALAGRRSIDA